MRAPGQIKYMAAMGQVWKLVTNDDGLWQDRDGGLWAFRDADSDADSTDRCGIHPLSLNPGHPLTDACRVHDFMYSSPEYQAFHTRLEADEYLRMLAEKLNKPITGSIFKRISRWFGKRFWENKRTNI